MRQGSNLLILQDTEKDTMAAKLTIQEENKNGNSIDIFGITIPA